MASDEHQGFHPISAGVWRACAGKLVHLPKVNSRVFYFADGHAEQASSKVKLPSAPAVLCQLTKLTFLVDPRTEEVLVKFRLQPLRFVEGFGVDDDGASASSSSGSTGSDEGEVSPNSGPNPGFVSYNKILTISDANNGGGFSVPRYCAETVFPKLNFNEDPPVMNIRIADGKGQKWEFRHIYRGTPRRHLLTTGWSKYVNAKYLVAGDTVVFIRDTVTDDLFVGLRRVFMAPFITREQGREEEEEEEPVREPADGFSRRKRGRVPPKDVLDAAEKALHGIPFEAVYYPRFGMPEFVVAAEKVKASCGIYWTPGTRVKMSLETDDGLRETWHNGSIASVVPAANRTWPGCCWRMLEVSWDEETEGLKAMRKVNPWQLKLLGPATPPDAFPPLKKFKAVHNSGLPTDAQGDIPLPTMGLHPMMEHNLDPTMDPNSDPMMDNLDPPFANYSTIVDGIGIQGTRHLLNLLPSIPKLSNPMEGIDNLPNPMEGVDKLPNLMEGIDKLPNSVEGIDKLPNLMEGIDAVEGIGGVTSLGHHDDKLSSSASQSPITGPPSDRPADNQNTALSIDGAAPEQRKSNLVTGKVPVSFQLFGSMIHTERSLAGQ